MPVLGISAITGEGCNDLVKAVQQFLEHGISRKARDTNEFKP
jgi:putative protein kinase ArgK-like GTPase of G3E family